MDNSGAYLSTDKKFRTLDRRDFLKLSGTGLAGALLVGSLGASKTRAQTNASLEEEFKAAARTYGVPVLVLKAMGYVNTRWEMPPPEASDYEKGNIHGWGGYGIMHLVRNPSTDTLVEASKLTGIPVEGLKTDRAANIVGGAALLSQSQGSPEPTRLGDWFGAVAGNGGNGTTYQAPSGIGGREIYAEQVFDALRRGASRRTKGGERVTLRPRKVSR
jgi:hypothetical protein